MGRTPETRTPFKKGEKIHTEILLRTNPEEGAFCRPKPGKIKPLCREPFSRGPKRALPGTPFAGSFRPGPNDQGPACADAGLSRGDVSNKPITAHAEPQKSETRPLSPRSFVLMVSQLPSSLWERTRNSCARFTTPG